jgi:nucleotide-binding universal stress UspA family protein
VEESIFSSGRILWATDGSEEAELAGRNALEIADKTGSELHVLHVGPAARYAATAGGSAALSSAQEALDKEAWRLLITQIKKVEAVGGSIAQAHLRSSERPGEEIVALAEEISAGLVAVGSRGLGGMRRALLGSVSDSVIRHAHGSVLVVRKDLEPSQSGNTAS